jgi:hypothetical protein
MVFVIRLRKWTDETNRQLSGFIRVCKGSLPSHESVAFNSYKIIWGEDK